jgi:hypothetical protein
MIKLTKLLRTKRCFVIAIAMATVVSMILITSPAIAEELLCDGTPRAEGNTAADTLNRKITPPPGNKPTPVSIGLYLTKLTDIDEFNSRFRFEAYARFEWCDPREAFDAEAEGSDMRQVLVDPRKYVQLWTPDLSIANGIGEPNVTKSMIEIWADGRVRISGYFNSAVTVPFDLRHFPFDRQSFEIELESFSFNREEIELHWMENFGGYQEDIYLPEWRIESTEILIDQPVDIRDQVAFSRAVFVINVAREYGYYIFKLSIPLLLIVALSWTVFWMHDESLASRMRVSATAFLTIVAYQFAISNSLPKVAYLTTMDRLMIASFVLVALSALQNMIVRYVFRDNRDVADTVDRLSRWLFPVAFGTVIATIAGLYID